MVHREADRSRPDVRKFWMVLILALTVPGAILADPSSGQPVPSRSLPLIFEPNRGQAAPPARFVCRARTYQLFLTSGEAILRLTTGGPGSSGRPEAPPELRLRFRDAEPRPVIRGVTRLGSHSNYLIGPRSEWIRRVPHYREVAYRDLYSGIDLRFLSREGELEYDFHVSPGVDPSAIAIDLIGADDAWIDDADRLHLRVQGRKLEQTIPLVYQVVDGHRRELGARHVLETTPGGTFAIRFDVEEYDRTLPLVIDPVLTHGTFFGGSSQDRVWDLARDDAGNVYIAGDTQSVDLPLEPPFNSGHGGGFLQYYGFVTKLRSDLGGLRYSTYYGGFGPSSVYAIDVDSQGRAVIGGFTTAGGPANRLGFLTMLTADGSDTVYEQTLPLGTEVLDVAVDSSGVAYATGRNLSTGLVPSPGAAQTSGGRGFVLKRTAIPAEGDYVTFLGGTDGNDLPVAIAVDGEGHAYVCGLVTSTDFPVLAGAYQSERRGSTDIFVTKIHPDGTAFLSSTLVGGADIEQPEAMTLDSSGHVWITGGVLEEGPNSPGGPEFPLVQPLPGHGPSPIFACRLLPDLSDLVFSTQLSVDEEHDTSRGMAIAADPGGHVYIAGKTWSSSFPLVDEIQSTPGNFFDGFIIKLVEDGSEVEFATYLASNAFDNILGLDVGENGRISLAGETNATGIEPNIPVGPDPFRSLEDIQNQGSEVFVSTIDTVDPVPGPPFLEYGVPLEVELTSAERERPFRLATAAGNPVTLSVTNLEGSAENALYMRYGEAPTPAIFDHAANEIGQQDQRQLISHAREGTLELLLRAPVEDGATQRVELLAEITDLAIDRVSIDELTTGGEIHLAIRGVGFNSESVFTLEPDDGSDPLPARDLVLVSENQMDLAFDLSEASPGPARLVIVNSTTADRVEFPVALVSPPRPVESGEPPLALEISAPEAIRARRPVRVRLDYENRGAREIDAPLLRVKGPPGSRIRLDSESEFHPETIEVLAVHHEGVAGKLPPGASGRIDLIVEFEVTGPSEFEVEQWTPAASDFMAWNLLEPPAGIDASDWAELWPSFSAGMGDRWTVCLARLADRATRLARRGRDPAAAAEAFRQLAQDSAEDSRRFAAVGILRHRSDGSPVARRTLQARSEGVVVSSTVTEVDGFFVLECLERDRSYTLELEGADLEDATLAFPEHLPPEADLLGLRIFAVEGPGSNPETLDCEPGSELGLQLLTGTRLALPLREGTETLRTRIATHSATVARSNDPNTKDGPGEGQPGDLVAVDEVLAYEIHFENLPKCPEDPDGGLPVDPDCEDDPGNEPEEIAPAQVVTVSDPLDGNDYDWRTFEVGHVVIASRILSLDRVREAGTYYRRGTRSASGLLEGVVPDSTYSAVRVRCDYDPRLGEIFWTFESVDPLTGEAAPLESLEGFLPARTTEDDPLSKASVNFTIEPRKDLEEGDDLRNEGTIVFDAEPPISTDETHHVISYFLPGDLVFETTPPPGSSGSKVNRRPTLTWPGIVNAASYELYLWEGSDPDRPDVPPIAVTGLQDTVFTLPGELDPEGTYTWQVVARGVRDDSLESTTSTFVVDSLPPPPPGDPALLEPVEGTPGVPTRPTLRWNPAPDARAYSLYLWREGEERPTEPTLQGLEGAELELPFELDGGTEYSWAIAGVNESGESLLVESSFSTGSDRPPSFRRGDVNDDGVIDIGDVLGSLLHQFAGAPPPLCSRALDSDDSGQIDLADPVLLLHFLFLSGPAPASPFPACGIDETPDGLDCEPMPGCE